MVVLALDTATRQGSTALLINGTSDARAGDASRTHGERLPAEILDLLGAHGLSPRDVDRFAVVAGPGSFTGLRVGMAAIQGLALVTGRDVVPVPTLEAMAEAWRIPEPRNPGTSEPRNLVFVLDGQRGDVFFAAWRLAADTPIESAECLIEPSVGTVQDLVARVRREAWTPACVAGIGLDRHLPALGRLGVPVGPVSAPLADVAARMAARQPGRARPPHALRPIYIRRPDAVLARERARSERGDEAPR